MSDFAFPFTICEAESPAKSSAFGAIIPSGISHKEELFAQLATRLRFPAYFGHNWDSLEECLRDFSWLAAPRIVIAHHDLPLASSKTDQQIYLRILVSALQHWRGSDLLALTITFPATAKSSVTTRLRG